MLKKILLWGLAVIITLGAVVYQRKTGPTNPKMATIIVEAKEYQLRFPRSVNTANTVITFMKNAPITQGDTLYYRKHNSNDNYIAIAFSQSKDRKLCVELPQKVALDKIDYYVAINGQKFFNQEPLVLRYKDPVPAGCLILHIVFMFLSMLFAAYGLLIALFDKFSSHKIRNYLYITLIMLILGGFILGTIVQKYAFGAYWSGFPFGSDLTDNKTLFALIALLLALPFCKKTYFRYIAIVAFFAMLFIFCIPHSV